MNILLIGNGFDLAHKLPTKYSDFLDFVNAFKDHDDSDYSTFLKDIKDENIELYKEIGSLIKDNTLIDYFLRIYKELCESGKGNWIDFESEIALIIENLDYGKKYVEEQTTLQSKGYVKLDRKYLKYLQPFLYPDENVNLAYSKYDYSSIFFDNMADVVLDSLNKMIRLLEIYLYEYVEKLDVDFELPIIKTLGVSNVLSFNYTDTFQKLYDSDFKAKYCYIHGKAQDSNVEDCDIVLGIDEYLPEEERDKYNQYVWFKKFYQRIYKHTSSVYLDWISSHLRNLNSNSQVDLFIIGHSLDVTDKDVLNKLMTTKNVKTYIYYHDNDALAKQISNLVKVIGEETLIEMTGGGNRRIEFLKLPDTVMIKKD